ncbi:MAG: ATP-dependent DNA helicase [Cellulosilyticum sp.]|nr:ATP-dependent DNA helicase [Cellulosilyticum sp.]
MRITEGLVKISVRELVEFVLRQGSIKTSVASNNRAVIGTLAHKKIQESMGANYEAEVRMVYERRIEDITFVIEGRADGVIRDLVSVTIDEIKTTTTPLEAIDENFNPLHWAQAKCYAYFYAKDKNLHEMQVRLTYYNIETKEIKHLQKAFPYGELQEFFEDVMRRYYKWIRFYMDWCKKRDGSLLELTFPFPSYRKGQRQVAVSVYKTIREGQKLFINAPTGIGKTISTLFPSLKAMGEGRGSKIFYLTAKTITRMVAEEGVIKLQKQGAELKSITLTAKDKICFCDKRQCHPDFCQWANGHYDRVDEAVYEIITKENLLTRELIEKYARRYQVCPFELALDLSVWADVVICDYNYIFDPNVGLKRFVDHNDFILLVDEAHNLVDRAREMYSAGISKKQVLAVKKLLGREHSAITKELTKINEYLLDIRRTYIEDLGVYISKEAPKNLYTLLRRFLGACDKKLVQKGSELPNELLDLYFEAYNFNRCYELFDEHYICYAEHNGSEVYMKQFCMDPSLAISEVTKNCKSTIFFSATLLPIDYFKDMLGGKDEIAYNFESPFEERHALRMIAADVSTRYKDRESSLDKICDYIEEMMKSKKGHYMVFFPSYKYMTDTYEHFLQRYGIGRNQSDYTLSEVKSLEEQALSNREKEINKTIEYDVKDMMDYPFTLYKQGTTMSEEEREDFLSHFEDTTKATLNFCVLGGIFSEGIDLTEDKLIGVAVVGVGIPQIGLERDLIKGYFDEVNKDGYHYAYTYPGMNKVLQAVGRLIRTEEDKGIILLIDDRYRNSLYQSMLPHYYEMVYQPEAVSRRGESFWKGRNRIESHQ